MDSKKEIQENIANVFYCDICNLYGRKSVPASYDSKTTYGIRAYLCDECFKNIAIHQNLKDYKEVNNG